MGFKIGKTKAKKYINYAYTPQTTDELKIIIEKRLRQNPDDTNFNDIDVSQITSMRDLFLGTSLNNNMNKLDISEWDVSNVEDMEAMFYRCKYFDGKTIENWNVKNLKYANEMFYNCHSLNCDFSKWNIQNLEEAEDMFYRCESFEGKGLENWNTSNINTMSGMFDKCLKLNCDLSKWDVSNVTNMEYMFDRCANFEGKGLKKWNIIKCHSFERMFRLCSKFNENLENWGKIKKDISEKALKSMFDECDSLKVIPSWYVNSENN